MKQQKNTPSNPERWKPLQFIKSDGTIETYPNYLVSDHGRVASMYGKTMKIKKLSVQNTGYLQVGLWVNGKRFYRTVHRLVLSTFHPEQYFSGAEIDHVNRDPTDNRLTNLRFADRNVNCANRGMNPLKKIRVTWLDDMHAEEFSNMSDCGRAFGKGVMWCGMAIRRGGFIKKYGIKIEKI